MTTIYDLGKDQIEKVLGREIDPAHLIVAKNKVFGTTDENLCEILQCEQLELEEVLSCIEYREVYAAVAARRNSQLIEKNLTLDQIESLAWERIAKKLPAEQDIEILAKIATMANRAVRRDTSERRVIDPSLADETIAITLTQTFAAKLQSLNNGTTETLSLARTKENFMKLKSPNLPQVKQYLNIDDDGKTKALSADEFASAEVRKRLMDSIASNF